MNFQEEQLKLLRSINEKLAMIVGSTPEAKPPKKKKGRKLTYTQMADREFKKLFK